jgi:hypothetical protein
VHGHISPSEEKVSTVAALVDRVAAEEVLRGEHNVDTFLDAVPIGKSLGGSEGPARSALLLISDWVDAVWPFLTGVKLGGYSDGLLKSTPEAAGNLVGDWVKRGAGASLGFHHGHLANPFFRSNPAVLRVVDLVDHLISDNWSLVKQGHGGRA